MFRSFKKKNLHSDYDLLPLEQKPALSKILIILHIIFEKKNTKQEVKVYHSNCSHATKNIRKELLLFHQDGVSSLILFSFWIVLLFCFCGAVLSKMCRRSVQANFFPFFF